MKQPETQLVLKSLMAEMTDAVLVYNEEGSITLANPIALELLGIEENSNYHAHLPESFKLAGTSSPDPLELNEYPHIKALQGNPVTGKDYTLLLKHRPSKIVTLFSSPISDSEEKIAGAFVRMRNISLRLHTNGADCQEKAGSDQPNASDIELESFIYAVSHDLQAPLRHIMGFSSLLTDEYSNSLDENGALYIKRMQDACTNMQQQIIDLLKLSRNTRGRMFCSVVNLSEIAKAVVERLKMQEPSRKVDITIQEGLETEGDQRLLIVLLEHLIGNAWKFTLNAEDPQLEFGSKKIGSNMVYFVRDNGIGIDLKNSDKLFLPFKRYHNAEFEGNGIGLATSLRIINRHAGKIWFESELNYGTSVFFTLGMSRPTA